MKNSTAYIIDKNDKAGTFRKLKSVFGPYALKAVLGLKFFWIGSWFGHKIYHNFLQ